MGSMRKAGMWLGLVEDDVEDGRYDDRRSSNAGYDSSDRYSDRTSGRYDSRDSRYDQHYADDELDDLDAEFDEPAPVRRREESFSYPIRANDRVSDRSSGSPVSAISRNSPSGRSPVSMDNLALAPEPEMELPPVAEPERNYTITTLHPTTYNEARTIGEHFRDGVPVIMNLTELEESDAKRLVDFSAGLAFGLRGSMERVTNRVFLLCPANVSVTAEERKKMAETGFFNQS